MRRQRREIYTTTIMIFRRKLANMFPPYEYKTLIVSALRTFKSPEEDGRDGWEKIKEYTDTVIV